MLKKLLSLKSSPLMARLIKIWEALFYSFPIQLLLNNFKRNQVLLLCWVILFAMITGTFGKYLGVPYLFLDPEYMNQVSFTSFAIMGLISAGFTTAFNITCYIADGHRFSFVGALSRPFAKFCLNNGILPLAFLITYIIQVIRFQINNEYSSGGEITINLLGFLIGYALMMVAFGIYFRFTQKDIIKYMVCAVDEKLKKNVRVTRASAMNRLDIARKKQVRVDNYVSDKFRFKKVNDDEKDFYDRGAIIQVFDQNHFNLIVIELFIFAFVLILGVFKDYPFFQPPAAASFMIFLTIFVMLSGAFSYWFGGWSITVSLLLFLILNYLVGEDFFTKPYDAFGLNYETRASPYTIANLQELNDSTRIRHDRKITLKALVNWRNKFPGKEKPKMVFLCVSGGGKRAALWTLTAMQTADSLSQGKLMDHTMLITGASGGLIGASYFRELKLREKIGDNVRPYSIRHRENISSDNLNPLIFSLLANDLFVGFSKFNYAGKQYVRDRAFTFEDQLNKNTNGLMEKSISDYKKPELASDIPMLIFSPTVINDGRKLYISPLPVSYMNSDILNRPHYDEPKLSGVDFQSLFEEQDGDSLRFLSALRMNATFPYITPNTTLPTDPPIQIMDAGVSDNFGLADAVRFIYSFRDWIGENTSGIVIVSIRDSPKLVMVNKQTGQTIIDDLTQPISSVYNNFENFQDITNDNLIGYAKSWFAAPIDRIDIEYTPMSYVTILQKMDSIRQHNARASLSWRLTTREKEGIMGNIDTEQNRKELGRLMKLLE
jgi:hypothetical protein